MAGSIPANRYRRISIGWKQSSEYYRLTCKAPCHIAAERFDKRENDRGKQEILEPALPGRDAPFRGLSAELARRSQNLAYAAATTKAPTR